MALDWQMTGSDAAGGAINILHHICIQHTYLTTPIQTIALYFIFIIHFLSVFNPFATEIFQDGFGLNNVYLVCNDE